MTENMVASSWPPATFSAKESTTDSLARFLLRTNRKFQTMLSLFTALLILLVPHKTKDIMITKKVKVRIKFQAQAVSTRNTYAKCTPW